MTTVGQLKRMLSEMKDEVPVVLNVSLAGDGRKKHSPWVEDFKACVTDYHRRKNECINVVMFYGVQPEISKRR